MDDGDTPQTEKKPSPSESSPIPKGKGVGKQKKKGGEKVSVSNQVSPPCELNRETNRDRLPVQKKPLGNWQKKVRKGKSGALGE